MAPRSPPSLPSSIRVQLACPTPDTVSLFFKHVRLRTRSYHRAFAHAICGAWNVLFLGLCWFLLVFLLSAQISPPERESPCLLHQNWLTLTSSIPFLHFTAFLVFIIPKLLWFVSNLLLSVFSISLEALCVQGPCVLGFWNRTWHMTRNR